MVGKVIYLHPTESSGLTKPYNIGPSPNNNQNIKLNHPETTQRLIILRELKAIGSSEILLFGLLRFWRHNEVTQFIFFYQAGRTRVIPYLKTNLYAIYSSSVSLNRQASLYDHPTRTPAVALR